MKPLTTNRETVRIYRFGLKRSNSIEIGGMLDGRKTKTKACCGVEHFFGPFDGSNTVRYKQLNDMSQK
jgi:hypothetical protein